MTKHIWQFYWTCYLENSPKIPYRSQMGLSLPTFFGKSNLATLTNKQKTWLLLTHIEARMKKNVGFSCILGAAQMTTHKCYSLVDVQPEMIPSPLGLDLPSSGFILVWILTDGLDSWLFTLFLIFELVWSLLNALGSVLLIWRNTMTRVTYNRRHLSEV